MEIVQGYSDKIFIKEQICELFTDIFSKQLGNSVFENDVYWIIITWYGKPIAMTALMLYPDNIWFMFNFGVRTLRRREGWGKKLWNEVITLVGNKELAWFVDPSNIDAQLFYYKMGAVKTEDRIEDGKDTIVMRWWYGMVL